MDEENKRKNFKVGDVLTMKKKHPCGSYEWTVLYAGSDVKLSCKGCGREILVKRSGLVKGIKNISG